MEAERDAPSDIDPNESPFATRPVVSLPLLARNDEEDDVIEAILERAERERAAAEVSDEPAGAR